MLRQYLHWFFEGSEFFRMIIIALLGTVLLFSLVLTPLDSTAIWVSSPLGFGTDSTDVSFSLIARISCLGTGKLCAGQDKLMTSPERLSKIEPLDS